MVEIAVEKIEDIINACPNSINLMFLGDSGVGKTTCVERYCKKNNIYLKTLILSQLDASEALGVPTTYEMEYNSKKIKVMDQAIPKWVIDLAEHKNAMLFLDEFLCSDPSVMNSFLNLLSQKRVGDFDLSHVKFVAATNIGSYTFDPDFNILTRFCFFYVVNNKPLKNLPFIYNYYDETEKEGVIFEPRRLVPRCADSLADVDMEHLSDFYEGFTNSNIITEDLSVGLKYSTKVSLIVNPFVDKAENGKYFINNEMLLPLSEVLHNNYPRVYGTVVKSLTFLSEEQSEYLLKNL